ncbi:hypothetical protein FE391_18840 [Nonomuraea sp. KC401]|uniref:putative glycolipid-binding domain-containing protein n=1 Tax=unclassified Nonomuraea TaxID=2593643 RepID=UPI0010FE5302|nr:MULTISPECIES: putative glycolipid-binding domain-containing protein [unclassified Nonomuraea]NBE97013.1 hypothetical protein [Nonomuraea sp. K271]TLF71611.1 hypothetical protein FE391_18840 [Nonomuraea sp. KC401]
MGTRRAEIRSRPAAGSRHTVLDGDGDGGRRIDGVPAPRVGGCPDVDLEASAVTNAFRLHRMRLAVGVEAGAPAAYVRAP